MSNRPTHPLAAPCQLILVLAFLGIFTTDYTGFSLQQVFGCVVFAVLAAIILINMEKGEDY